MAVPESKTEEPISDALRRVMEALLAGETPPPDAQASLTASEQQEVASLIKTANLTYLTLQQPEPSETVEAVALARAQTELARRYPVKETGSNVPTTLVPARSEDTSQSLPWWQRWLDRLKKN